MTAASRADDRLHHPAARRRGDRDDRDRGDHVPAAAPARGQARSTTCSGREASPAAIAAWNQQHGYDRPLSRPVPQLSGQPRAISTSATPTSWARASATLFNENAGRSAYLSRRGLVLSLLIAIPLGIAQAVKRNSVGDYTATTLTFVLYSMPSFFLGLILIQFFALRPAHLPAAVSDIDHDAPGGRSPTRAQLPAADRHAGGDQRRVVQPLHALLGAGQPRPGLHPPGPGQGAVAARRALPPPAAQRLPADDHAGRPVDPDAAGRQPARRGAVQLSRASACCSSTRSATRTTRSCSPTRSSAGS